MSQYREDDPMWEKGYSYPADPPKVNTRLKELAKADSEGRVIVLPCKIGDTLFRICRGPNVNMHIREFVLRPQNFHKVVYEDDLGKTLFLSRKEALEAMEAMKKEAKL